LVIPLKNVNRPGTPKLWAITHEMSIKRYKDEFLVINLKHANRPGTPELWIIAHENGNKKQKRRVFGHTSETCQSPWNPNNMGNNSSKSHKTQKRSFWSCPQTCIVYSDHLNRPRTQNYGQ
jgi:hypothetical protein